MPLAEIEVFLGRVMTDVDFCRRFLDDPEEALTETALSSAERWAVLESLREDDETGHDFLELLRTRLAVIGIQIGRPPRALIRIFACAPNDRGTAGTAG